MSDEVSHLTAGAVELLGETDERRIRAAFGHADGCSTHAPSRLSIDSAGCSKFREELECLLLRSTTTAAWARR